MKKIADVKEITHNKNHQSIIYAISPHDDVCKERILAYLKSGDIILKADEKFVDAINQKEIEHTPLCYCDGEYEWSTEEIYYVEKYNLCLNKDFLLKIGIDGKEKHRKRSRYSDGWK